MFAEMIGRAGGYQDLFCCTYGGKDGREDKYLMMECSTLALFTISFYQFSDPSLNCLLEPNF
jgi:hypothetical protein